MLQVSLALAGIALLPLRQEGAAPVRVLFLGDQGHHRPSALAAFVRPVLEKHAITLDYTEDVSTISPAGLEGFDVLLVYANIDSLPPPAEAALLAFVSAGKGLVALHCASYCFRDSQAWVELVGAQFESHGTGVFAATIADAEHALTRGFAGFSSWDETYVHRLHNPDRHVLAWRVDEQGREPWTWVRAHGQGRVFYTASGHDERTWQNPGFQDLLVRGIRWSAGVWAFPEPAPLPALHYVQAEVPEYRADGGQGRIASMQAALDPEASRQYLVAAPDLEVELYAAEPRIGPTIAMTWDDRGRAWLAESVDYPNDRRDEGGHDRILICEDSDGDGSADRSTVFADGLSIPTSLVLASGGLIVAQAPHVLFLEDLDGDDRAERQSVLFTGFGTADTHAGPSNFRLGFDGWIWGTVGYSGFDGSVGGEHHRFGQGVFRFRPDGSTLEFLGSTSNNTWGLGLDETGEVFVSTANHDQINTLGLPNRVYESVDGWNGRAVRFIGDYREFHPLAERVRQVDWHGGFTAAAGCAPYTARVFPERYWNRVAFLAEPTGHLVGESILERVGAGFVAHDGWNLLASRDEWTAPVAAEVGPDGAVWVIDWYNYIVQHNPTPRGYETGAGSAYVTPLRDTEHARIWRVFPRGASLDAFPPIQDREPGELQAALDHPNLYWRMRAQEHIVADRRVDLAPALFTRAAEARLDAIENDPGALHALCALAGLGALADERGRAALSDALHHPAPAVRKFAVRFLPRDQLGAEMLAAARSLHDPDAFVRREALVAASEMPPSAALGAEVLAILLAGDDLDDPWLADAALAAAARNDLVVLLGALAHLDAAAVDVPPERRNLLPNPSFEEPDPRDPAFPASWRPRTYSGRAEHAWVEGGRGGGHCVRIGSREGSDTSWFADVEVTPGATYRLAGWIRTEELVNIRGALGALMNVHVSPQPTLTPAIEGTRDWQPVELVFESGDRDRLSINCLFGGWGQSRGTSWFDDVSLTQVSDAAFGGLPKELATILSRVTAHFAHEAPLASMPELFAALREADPEIGAAVVRGLFEGWPRGTPMELDRASRELLRALLGELSRQRATELAVLFAAQGIDLGPARTKLVEALAIDVGNEDLPLEDRAQAAQSWVAIEDTPETRAALLNRLGPRTEPALATALVDALASSTRDDLAPALLERWHELAPGVRSAALRVLRRRPSWTEALLDAVTASVVSRGELSAQDWQQLQSSPDAHIAERARTLSETAHGTPSARIAATLARLAAAPSEPGDPVRGGTHFERLCATCHHLGDAGGPVGPALDGMGARSLAELLSEIVDPNRSVEATYQMWVVQTVDGLVLAGRLVNESKSSIELLTTDGTTIPVAREEIEASRASNVSLMPEGLLDELDLAAVADLLAFLALPRTPPPADDGR